MISVYYAQARNENAAGNFLVPYSQALLAQAVANFSSAYAKQFFTEQGGNATAMAILAQAPQTIAQPVYWTYYNMRPFTFVAFVNTTMFLSSSFTYTQRTCRYGHTTRRVHLPHHLQLRNRTSRHHSTAASLPNISLSDHDWICSSRTPRAVPDYPRPTLPQNMRTTHFLYPLIVIILDDLPLLQSALPSEVRYDTHNPFKKADKSFNSGSPMRADSSCTGYSFTWPWRR